MTTTELGVETVDDPTDLDRREYVAALKRTLKEIKEDDVPGLAGGVAFKMFMSLFPSLLAAVAVFSLVTTPAEIADWLSEARGILPDSAIELLRKPLLDLAQTETGFAGMAAVLGVATGLFAATSAAISLMKALSRAYGVPETRKFVRQRLIALALTLALLIALIAIVLLLVVGRQVQETLLPGVPPPLSWLLVAARFALALGVLVMLFAFVYWTGPNRDHPSWVWMSPGALFAVIGWLVVAGGFTLYAQTSPNYNKTYASLAGVVVLLIWLQLSMQVLLIGAEFNAEVERTRAVRLRVTEGAGFAAPAPAAALAPDGSLEHAAVRQAEVAAPTLEVAPAGTMTPAAQPEKVGTVDSSVSAPPSSRRNSVAVAGLMAIAVFLGFARRRSQR